MIIDEQGRYSNAMEFHEAQKRLREEFEKGRKKTLMVTGQREDLEELKRRNEEIQARYLKKKADQRQRKLNKGN